MIFRFSEIQVSRDVGGAAVTIYDFFPLGRFAIVGLAEVLPTRSAELLAGELSLIILLATGFGLFLLVPVGSDPCFPGMCCAPYFILLHYL